MNANLKTKVWTMFLLVPILWYGCASAPKATLPPNANANDEIVRMKNDLAKGRTNDFGVLARNDFEKAQDHLMEAEASMRDGDPQSEVLEHVAIARGYYEQADIKAANRRSTVESAMDARSRAIQAGAMKFPQSREELSKADNELRDLTESDSVPSAEKVKKLQDQYSHVEMVALEISHLGPASAMIQQAEDHHAAKVAPNTLNQARVDYFAARNALANNRETRGSYQNEVRQANLSADTLSKVMAIHDRNPDRFNERQAVLLVWQERRANSLARMESRNEMARMQFEEKALANATAEIKSRFKPSEANVVQEGGDIVIQLKSMNFPVGKSELPKKADPLLVKAQSVISDFQPSKVVVQGHADSTGSKEINEQLSQKRAEAVADNLKENKAFEDITIEAVGSDQPLASNKTKMGRAQNRRADIILTPSDRSF